MTLIEILADIVIPSLIILIAIIVYSFGLGIYFERNKPVKKRRKEKEND